MKELRKLLIKELNTPIKCIKLYEKILDYFKCMFSYKILLFHLKVAINQKIISKFKLLKSYFKSIMLHDRYNS